MYDKMSEELKTHEPKNPIDVKNTKENSVCIGRCNKSNKYYRVIINEIEKTSQPRVNYFFRTYQKNIRNMLFLKF